ncbi:MAG: chromosomal replication initiator protein DnaA [Candidatus Kerfeldbacteria bacterium]|nr:chromosomal replication initiator protein DnaA [Candidatus Kerfeldbacteria bacterium]
MKTEEIWKSVLGELELSISRANFTTWFKSTFILNQKDNEMVVAVPNTFTKSWLENKYHKTILEVVQHITDHKVWKVTYEVETRRPERMFEQKSLRKQIVAAPHPKIERAPRPRVTAPAPVQTPAQSHNLNPRYTFESFVVGKTNELARAASHAVAEKPGLRYNPLFIFGGVGLGKTHLMQAVGHDILHRDPTKRVLYITCEDFTNEFIRAVQKGSTDSFKNMYRSVDVLLVDDIQFIAGKEGTQEEFFHTFNALHQANRQIVISSDRPPKAIPALEHRLVSRFEWGMTADISNPDLETRMAILSKKCEEKGFQLPEDMVELLATNIFSNIRELEGALNKIIAYHELNNVEPNEDSVKHIISLISTRPRKGAITARGIMATVAEFFDISVDDLAGNSRKKELVVPRQITMFLMREEMKSSYPNIGQELGGRDHTTAMHAYTKIQTEIEHDEKIKHDIAILREKIYVM